MASKFYYLRHGIRQMDMEPSLRASQPMTFSAREYIACNRQQQCQMLRHVKMKHKSTAHGSNPVEAPSRLPCFIKPHTSIFQCAWITLHSNSPLANLTTSILLFVLHAMSQSASPGDNSGTDYFICTSRWWRVRWSLNSGTAIELLLYIPRHQ